MPRPAPSFRPRLETLEGREVPAVFTVTNTSADYRVAGSLPYAVFQANYNSPGFDNIRFNIAGAGTHVINLTATLYVNSQMAIEGNTQPGYDGSRPLISVRGSDQVPSLFLLQNDPSQQTTSTGSTVQGLSLSQYTANAVTVLVGSTGNFIQNNWIGFDKDAAGNILLTTSAFRPPNYYPAGVGIQSSFNTVRDNSINGVYNGVVIGEAIEGNYSGTVYKTNSFQRNTIGVGPDGATAAGYGNLSDGIFVGAGGQQNFLGPDNVLSNNASSGAELLAPSVTGNVIFRNKIGTDATGQKAVGNGELGILIGNNATYNAIGGSFGGNVIAANRLGGISLGTNSYPGAPGNYVQNNIIGLTADQTAVLGTQGVGISIQSAAVKNVVQANVIGGHTSHGIVMAATTGDYIQGNWIGRNAAGRAFANGGFGVTLLAGASYNYVVQNAFGTDNLGDVYTDPAAVGNVRG